MQFANFYSSRGQDPSVWFDKAMNCCNTLNEMSECATLKVAMEVQLQAILEIAGLKGKLDHPEERKKLFKA